uniref:Uncharacterized protein n=1 Tax=Tanacetum cinerariifolium TaxID=118510 RepID=A0A6L2NAH0_TANCI|nr:hypothetical protein [Tanacetum cinerariifolium]
MEKLYCLDPNAQDNTKQWKRCCFHKFTTISCYGKDVAEMLSPEIDDMLRIRVREAGSDEEIFTYVAWIMNQFTSSFAMSFIPLINLMKDLDTTTPRDLIDCDGKLIPEDPQPAIEHMKYRQSYHWDSYHGVFEHMDGVYSVLMQGAYNSPSYAQPQYGQYYQQYQPPPPQYQQQQDDDE